MRNIFLLVAFAGCGSVQSDFVRTRAAPAGTPRSAFAVEVFILERPTRPFREVGFVEVRGGNSAGALMNALRARAGKEGCSAVAFLGDNDHLSSWSSSSSATSTSSSADGSTTTSSSTSSSASTDIEDGYRAVCLVYIDAPTTRTARGS